MNDSIKQDFLDLIDAWSAQRQSTMEIGWYGAKLKRENGYAALGMTEIEARDRIGVSKRTWGRMVRIAEALRRLDKTTFLALTAANADQLARLPEQFRCDPQLVAWALEMSEDAFKRRLLEWRADREGIPVPELRVSLKLLLFQGQKDSILEALHDFMRDHAITDMGQGLELALMEVVHRRTLVDGIRSVLPLLRQAHEAEDFYEAKLAVGEAIICISKVCDSISVSDGR